MKKHWYGILCAFCLLLLMPTALAAEPDAQTPPDMAELLAVSIASGPCGAENPEDLIWTLNDSGTMTFIGSGDMADYELYQPNGDKYATRAPWFDYRDKIKSVVIPEGVTRIGAGAFYGQGDYSFLAIASVSIPESVTSIGDYAIFRCQALTEISLPKNLTEIGAYAFPHNSGLTEIRVPDGVTKIGEGAFYDNANLEKLTLPASVKEMGADVFKDCPKLTLTVYGNSYAHRYAISNSVRHTVSGNDTVYVAGGSCGADKAENLLWRLDENGTMTFIGSGAMADYEWYQPNGDKYATRAPWFSYRDKIESVVIPEGITKIGTCAFYGQGDYRFAALSSVSLPKSVTAIGNYAFFGCLSLANITLPDKLKTIGERVFLSNGALTNLTIPASVISIGEGAFLDCAKLTLTVYENSYAHRYAISNSVRHTVSGNDTVYVAGGSCGAEKAENLLWRLDENGAMTFIGSGAMADYELYQPDGDKWATKAPWFGYRDKIKSVVIPEGVTRIGAGAFYGQGDYSFLAIASVSIPESVTSIGDYAIFRCQALTEISLPKNLTEIGAYAFPHNSGLTEIRVPDGVTKIGEGAFYDNANLEKLTLPASVKEIGVDVFKDCPKLTLMVYEGSYAHRYALLNSVRHDTIEEEPEPTPEPQPEPEPEPKPEPEPEPQPGDVPTVGALSYKFSNSRAGFGYPADYRIPYERYVSIFGDKVMTKYLFHSSGTWGGNCYGVSTSAALFFRKDNGILASAFRDGASVPLNLELSDSNGAWKLSLKEFIECMQVSQFSPAIQNAYLTRKNRLQELCEAVEAFGKGGQNPVVVAVFGPEGGHALLGYKIESVSATQSRLYVYDSNYPEDAERYLTLNVNASGEYKGWYYPINSKMEWGSALPGCWISYVPYADFYQVWQNRDSKGGGNLELLTVNDNARIYDADGLPVASIQDGELITGRDDMFPMIDIGITADGEGAKREASVWIPPDMYTVKRVAPKLSGGARLAAESPFVASVTHMEQSAKVSTTAGSVVFAVDDESQINMVSIGEDEQGKTYEITLNSSLESSENEEIRLTGTVLSKALTFMQVNGVARYSGITSDDGSGVAAGTTLTIDGRKFELRAASDSLPVLSFAPNGGAGSMSPRATDTDKSIVLPSCEFVPPDGKEFDGWLVNGKKYQAGERCELTENASASAQWKAAGGDAYQIGNVTKDGQNINVEVTAPGTLFVAAYGENGTFLRTATKIVSASGAAAVALDTTGAKTVRAFLFDSNTMKPLCDGKAIDIQ